MRRPMAGWPDPALASTCAQTQQRTTAWHPRELCGPLPGSPGDGSAAHSLRPPHHLPTRSTAPAGRGTAAGGCRCSPLAPCNRQRAGTPASTHAVQGCLLGDGWGPGRAGGQGRGAARGWWGARGPSPGSWAAGAASSGHAEVCRPQAVQQAAPPQRCTHRSSAWCTRQRAPQLVSCPALAGLPGFRMWPFVPGWAPPLPSPITSLLQ